MERVETPIPVCAVCRGPLPDPTRRDERQRRRGKRWRVTCSEPCRVEHLRRHMAALYSKGGAK